MTAQANVLAQKAVLTNLAISRWGARCFDDNVTTEVLDKHKADKSVGLFTKRLLSKKAMLNINRVADQARIYHNRHTQPWFDDGVRILPTAIYMAYSEKMREYKNAFAEAVTAFVDEYPKAIKQAKTELGDLFNEKDYPSQARMEKMFGFEIAIFPCPDKADFRVGLEPEELAIIQADLDARMAAQLHQAMQHAGQRIAKVVGHMAERLKAYKPPAEGKGKGKKKKSEGIFHDSLVKHVRDLADLLPAFNLQEDPDLTEIHRRIVTELCAHDAEDLRKNDATREHVAKQAEEIMKSVADFLS